MPSDNDTPYQNHSGQGSQVARDQINNPRSITLGERSTYIENLIENPQVKCPQHHLTLQPLFNDKDFLGRDDELTEIHRRLTDRRLTDSNAPRNCLLLVNGEGGIGKTTLASCYYQRYHDAYQHVAWLLGEGDIINDILRLAEHSLAITFAPQADKETRFQQTLTELSNLKKFCLFVFDNANCVDNLASLAPLFSLTNCHILVTSRITEFDYGDIYNIQCLAPEYALKLFRRHYPGHSAKEDDLFLQIYEAVGGNTLVLELLAKNLNISNKNKHCYSLTDLLSDLQSTGLLALLSNSKPVSNNYLGKGVFRSEKPEKIIAAMYDLEALPDNEKMLLAHFSVLPPQSIPFSHLDMLLDNSALEDSLGSLALKGWLEVDTDNTSYKCSPVIQEIVKAKEADSLYTYNQPLIRALIHYLDSDQGGNLKNSNYDLAQEFCHYGQHSGANITQVNTDIAQLFLCIGNYFTLTGNLLDALKASDKSLSLFKQLIVSDPDNPDYKNGLAISYEKLGSTHTALGNLKQALAFFELRSTFGEELYQAYPNNVSFKNGLAISYSKLGDTHTALGNLKQALAFFEKDLVLTEELYQAYPNNVSFKNGLAISYSKLGDTHTALGNLKQALAFFEKDLVLTEELYQAYPNNVSFKNGLAISYSKLGETHTALGNLKQALAFFELRSTFGEELYQAYPNNVSFKNGLAISYSKLGETHTALGNLKQALAFFEKDLVLTEELYQAYPNNVSFKNGLAISYSKLGETHTALGNLKQALAFFEDYRVLTEELYQAYPNNVSFKNGLAISYSKLGDTHTALGNLKQALAFFEKDLVLTEELYQAYPNNVSFKNGLAISYSKLGDTHTALGNLKQALAFFEKDLVLTEELYQAYPNNVSFKNGLAISYSKLGETHTALGNLKQALAFFELRSTFGEELYQAYPNNVSFKNGLAISYSKLGETHTALGNLKQALAFFEKDLVLTEELYQAYPNNVSFKNGLAISYVKLGFAYKNNNKGKDLEYFKAKALKYFKDAENLWLELIQISPENSEFKKNLDSVQKIIKEILAS